MSERKLEILVVEDNPQHIELAKRDLEDKGNLTIFSTYKQAIGIIRCGELDVVITDERIPWAKEASYPLPPNNFTGEALPLGGKVALYAIARQIPCVALITDVNHHKDEIAATQDDFTALCYTNDHKPYYGTKIGQTLFMMGNHNHLRSEGKNYLRTLRDLLEGRENSIW